MICPRCGGTSSAFAQSCSACGLRFDENTAGPERSRGASPRGMSSGKMIWLVVGVVAIGLAVGLVTVVIANSMFDSSLDGSPDDLHGRTFPSVQVDENQDNWTLTIAYYEDDSSEMVSMPGLDNIFLVVVSPDGEIAFSPKSLGSMEPGIYYDGVRFFNTGDLERLNSGDYLTLDSGVFERGSHVQLMWFRESGGGSIGFFLY